MNDANENFVKEDFEKIEQRRIILEQIIHITKAIETMQDSLNSVLILELPTKEFPKQALKVFNALSGTLKNLPTNKIQEYLHNLERVINHQLEKILKYSGMDFSSDENIEIIFVSSDEEDAGENVLNLLNDFKRTAQTAVSLRVLLKKRGVKTSECVLPVPKEVIQEQLKHLEAEEQTQRTRIRTEIVEMQNDLQLMIDNPAYPEAMKQQLIQAKENLQEDLGKIDAGKKLDSLNFVSETQELSDIDYEPEALEAEETQAQKPEKKSLSAMTSDWLNSSWDVSWNDVQKK
jgi:hypothetical protein